MLTAMSAIDATQSMLNIEKSTETVIYLSHTYQRVFYQFLEQLV